MIPSIGEPHVEASRGHVLGGGLFQQGQVPQSLSETPSTVTSPHFSLRAPQPIPYSLLPGTRGGGLSEEQSCVPWVGRSQGQP